MEEEISIACEWHQWEMNKETLRPFEPKRGRTLLCAMWIVAKPVYLLNPEEVPGTQKAGKESGTS